MERWGAHILEIPGRCQYRASRARAASLENETLEQQEQEPQLQPETKPEPEPALRCGCAGSAGLPRCCLQLAGDCGRQERLLPGGLHVPAARALSLLPQMTTMAAGMMLRALQPSGLSPAIPAVASSYLSESWFHECLRHPLSHRRRFASRVTHPPSCACTKH